MTLKMNWKTGTKLGAGILGGGLLGYALNKGFVNGAKLGYIAATHFNQEPQQLPPFSNLPNP